MVPARSLSMLALGTALAFAGAASAPAQIASLTASNADHAGQLDVRSTRARC